MAAYSGALLRSASAHFASRPPVPGVDPRHEHPDPDPDPFQPVPETPPAQTGDVWSPQDASAYTEMRDAPITHAGEFERPVPSNVHRWQRDIAWQARLMAAHAVQLFRPDTYVPYKHATQGQHIAYVQGNSPQNAGSTVSDDMAYLVMGRNSYDQTNGVTEVYGQEEGGNGRYRLGTRIEDWGLYEYPMGKFGQDAELRAYTGLEPQFPVDKPNVEDPAPYTPASSGTARWQLPTFQTPSFFSLPTETVMTDYEQATDVPAPVSDFVDDGRM
ncbi:hypothetical protein GA0115240_105811 [Streptomyces sp. DvalAA-14]|uniref:hypothetical protein n=1 Tax=unclassified Streptomyces TaxID=2593676 RepID=UPI00081BB502|nr:MULTISPECIES: hypothetical protein [unclassified Streptomyces]MYS19160.1 hypothetical protein [Streptomyces sp. SID4948]SCD38090.1 hypothetical protein GA0115240_105811 [Streptomyces sp. DvalAA-14]